MKGNFYIDNIDISERFGIVIPEGGYKDLLTFPALKEPLKNDWPEEDGIEVDLETPTLQYKTVTIPFVAANPAIEPTEFLYFITRPGFRRLRITDLDNEWTLRMNSQSEYNFNPQASSFSIQFIDDTVSGFRQKDYTSPEGGGIYFPDTGYELDNIPFSDYGIAVESGINEILKSPTIKQNLTRSFLTSDGQTYDADSLVFNSKEVTLQCCFITDTVSRFRECYHAFFNDWIQPGEHLLYCNYTGDEYPCYYKKSSAFTIEQMSPAFVCRFSLTLVFTSFRIYDTEYLLTAEDDRYIVLEDGETEVDMKIKE